MDRRYQCGSQLKEKPYAGKSAEDLVHATFSAIHDLSNG